MKNKTDTINAVVTAMYRHSIKISEHGWVVEGELYKFVFANGKYVAKLNIWFFNELNKIQEVFTVRPIDNLESFSIIDFPCGNYDAVAESLKSFGF